MPLLWKQDLTVDSYKQFAQELADYAYIQSQRATHDHHQAISLAASVIYGIYKKQNQFIDSDEQFSINAAFDAVLFERLSSAQKRRFEQKNTTAKASAAPEANPPADGEAGSEGTDSKFGFRNLFSRQNDAEAAAQSESEHYEIQPPSEETNRQIVAKACAKLRDGLPQNAPLYSGTKSGLILLVVLAFICGAVYILWNDPLGMLKPNDAQSIVFSSSGTNVAIPENDSLIDIVFEPQVAEEGSVPVKIFINGPDAENVLNVSYCRDGDAAYTPAYQCGDEYWVMMASANGYYKVSVKGTNELDAVRYIKIDGAVSSAPSVTVLSTASDGSSVVANLSLISDDGTIIVSSSDQVNSTVNSDGSYTLTAEAGKDSFIDIIDGTGNSTSLLLTSDGNAILSPEIPVTEILMGHDATYTVNLTELLPADRTYNISASSASDDLTVVVSNNSALTVTSRNNYVGIASINLSISDSYGLITSTAVPVVIVNSQPYCDQTNILTASVQHTPSNTGHLYGRLTAHDAENDKLTFKLLNQTDCKVTLSGDGSFLLFVDSSYRGNSAYFDFCVTDGLLESETYRYSVELVNTIIEPFTVSQKMICYAGENGWYTLNLPDKDNDGDTLNWTVTSSLTSSMTTPRGGTIAYGNGLSRVLYRIDPTVNDSFTDVITLTYSDGWLTGGTVTVECIVVPNKAPTAGKNNHAKITAEQSAGTFTLDISDDCEFDRCVITEVVSCTGGVVLNNTGWDALSFTMSFDDLGLTENSEPVEISAVLRVTDVVTGNYIDVTYTIEREK